MDPLVSLAEIKTYLGLTTTADDTLLGELVWEGTQIVQRDTGRQFAVQSNVTRYYSTNGQASLTIHDRPLTDATRTVTLFGTALDETPATQSVWFLQDWRAPGVTTSIQLRHFDRAQPNWYKAFPNWFDANLDRLNVATGTPNDLAITGVEGHTDLPDDVFSMTRRLIALLYWQKKAGASGFVQTPQGEELDVSLDRPEGYGQFVNNWRLRTAVVGV